MKNRTYADADDSGRITGTRVMPRRLIEIPGPLPRGRWRADADGNIWPTPDIILSLDTDIVLVAGRDCAGILTTIEPGVPGDTLPATLTINVNNRTAKVPSGLPILFDRPGHYDLKILGPWPWQSNKLSLYVRDIGTTPPPDGDRILQDVEMSVKEGYLIISPSHRILQAEAIEERIAILDTVENPSTEQRLNLLELKNMRNTRTRT